MPSTHVCEPDKQHSLPVHVMPLPKQELYVPATHVLPLPPLLLAPLLLPPELDEEEDDSPQNVLFERAHAASFPPHSPSMHAAAR